jgi:hypothetical protein
MNPQGFRRSKYKILNLLAFPNRFIGNLFECALTPGFPLKRFVGMSAIQELFSEFIEILILSVYYSGEL